MDFPEVSKLKNKLYDRTNDIISKIPRGYGKISTDEFYNELIDFRKCESDYLIVLAEQNIDRVAVALSRKTDYVFFVYLFEENYLVFFREGKYWTWKIIDSLESVIKFISDTENSY